MPDHSIASIVVGFIVVLFGACTKPMGQADARLLYAATKPTIDAVQLSTDVTIAAVPELVNGVPNCAGQIDCNIRTLEFFERRNAGLIALRTGAFAAAARAPGVVGFSVVMESAETKNELIGKAGSAPPGMTNAGRTKAESGFVADGRNVGWGLMRVGSSEVPGLEIVRKTRSAQGELITTMYIVESR